MVHRIQNRNSGYSDFSNLGSAQSFNFSPQIADPISNGANALKVENDPVQESSVVETSALLLDEELTSAHETEFENIINNNIVADDEKSFTQEAFDSESNKPLEEPSNGLENFGVDETPELFNSQNETESNESSSKNEDNPGDEDLEIPAFLRRQKN